MLRFIIILVVCLFCSLSTLYGQQAADSVQAPLTDEPEFKLSKAARMAVLSAAVPGLGQYQNKTGWMLKVPVIYAGGATLVWLTIQNHSDYRIFREAYVSRNDGNALTQPSDFFEGRTDDQLLRQRDRFRRDRDFYMILTGIFYLLNVAEAATTAHLNEFDVSDNLALRIKPNIEPIAYSPYNSAGFTLTFYRK
ncbi:MAG: hypothetical protein JJT94_07340 [Bernardetiaceae bacterium]|nr:hypothetical protein [Bernardetiaceae bacterium]